MSKNKKGLGTINTQSLKNHTQVHVTSKRLSTRLSNEKQRRFNRNKLPKPLEYYPRVLREFRQRNNNQAIALCPFHSDKKPSLSVDLIRGAFFCFSCRKGGGGLIDFYILTTGRDFVKAVDYFEAWDHE